MPGEPLSAPGYHGKLPARGDFITRRLPRSFVDVWDNWLQQAVASSRDSLGEAWLDAYLTGPIWRFVLPRGTCGEQAVAGLIMPSVDSVGRYFPMTIAALLPGRPNPFAMASEAESWFDGAEELALSGLAQGFRLESLDEGLLALGAPRVSVGADRLTAQSQAGELPSWTFNGDDEAPLFPAALPAVLDSLVTAQAPAYSLWWTNGSDRVAPSLRSYPALPAANSFAGFLSAAPAPAESTLADLGL